MEIKEIGEFGLIDRIKRNIKPSNSSTVMGIGDDAAVIHYTDKASYSWKACNSTLLILTWNTLPTKWQ